MTKSVTFYTLGCKTNQYETQAMREILESSGSFLENGTGKKSDIYIINTCTVTAKADKDARWTIRHCRRQNPDATIVVTGCLTERDEDAIKNIDGISLVVRNHDKHRIAQILSGMKPSKRYLSTSKDHLIYTPLAISDFKDHSKAFIKIQDGCDNFCSYCKVPLVRGGSRSRGEDDIIDEIYRLLKKGFHELVLTGICLGDWRGGANGGLRLHNLIEKIDSIDGEFRVRLSSLEPHMLTDELIRSIAKSRKICPHLHIPLQSGSNKILEMMKRPYTARDYRRLIRKARQAIKDVSITSDVMVGFPGESDKDFKDTVAVIRRTMPSRLHIFTYSPRNGTAASRMDQRPDREAAKKRSIYLEDIAKIQSYRYRRRFLKKRVEGLVEAKRDPKTNLLTGYTENYIRFLLDGPDSFAGKRVPLRVVKVDLKSTYCKHLFS